MRPKDELLGRSRLCCELCRQPELQTTAVSLLKCRNQTRSPHCNHEEICGLCHDAFAVSVAIAAAAVASPHMAEAIVGRQPEPEIETSIASAPSDCHQHPCGSSGVKRRTAAADR